MVGEIEDVRGGVEAESSLCVSTGQLRGGMVEGEKINGVHFIMSFMKWHWHAASHIHVVAVPYLPRPQYMRADGGRPVFHLHCLHS